MANKSDKPVVSGSLESQPGFSDLGPHGLQHCYELLGSKPAWTASDMLTIVQCGILVDRLVVLNRIVVDEGPVAATTTGTTKIHPAVIASDQTRTQLLNAHRALSSRGRDNRKRDETVEVAAAPMPSSDEVDNSHLPEFIRAVL